MPRTLFVLILLLVEYPFGHIRYNEDNYSIGGVLILLLVEYPFGQAARLNLSLEINDSLNPSFSGISFRTLKKALLQRTIGVLILLLVEYPFGL